MLMSDDKKKLSSLIVSRMSGQAEPVKQEDGAETDDSMPLESCADELLQAIEQKSAKGIVEALKSMLELLDKDEEPSQDEEPKY